MNKSPLKSWIIANFEEIGSILISAIWLIYTLIHAPYGQCGNELLVYFGLQLLVLFLLFICIFYAIGLRNILFKLLMSIGEVAVLIFFAYSDGTYYYLLLTTTIIATVIGGLTAFTCSRFVYFNFEDVVSRHISYRNSDVDQFEDKWKYTIDRFAVIFCYFIVSTAVITLYLSIDWATVF